MNDTSNNPLHSPTIAANENAILQGATVLPYSTTVPTFTPPKDGYQMLVKTGGLHYLYWYAGGQWNHVNASGASTTHTYGLHTRAGGGASGTSVIAHSLGARPGYVKLKAYWGVGTPQLMQSTGISDGTTTATIHSWTMVGTGGGADQDTTNIVYISDHAGNTQSATATIDSTNINLFWTAAGTLGATTIQILWEATL